MPKRKSNEFDHQQKRLAFGTTSSGMPLAHITVNIPHAPATVVGPSLTDAVLPVEDIAEAATPVMNRMLEELRRVTTQMAIGAIQKLRTGYQSRSGQVIRPASTNSKGCVLAQKIPQRGDNGYVQIPPEGLNPSGSKSLPQGAHRLAVVAYHPSASVQRLLYTEGTQASHLCHEPSCINHQHIVVESKAENEARKVCKSRVLVRTTILDHIYELSPASCPHKPACLPAIEERVAIAVGLT